ncbi:hypothetical protein PGTUg99_008223 [Puccinia graminis f. sp. tritici]|uniref:Uncharacterized protein n=1 Tax=Puccinia graminis f. sp. tritici TaxID=56615 RepID=A0A5B0S2E4_PUCGR|nr:hypothetical protein PGTUg99_008223 [Puccinia graminis f. sp. tritici]
MALGGRWRLEAVEGKLSYVQKGAAGVPRNEELIQTKRIARLDASFKTFMSKAYLNPSQRADIFFGGEPGA